MPKTKKKHAKPPVAVEDLPEYKNACAWAGNVRARAEREIERETVRIPEGVLARLHYQVGRGIDRRQADIVQLWSGTGAHGVTPGRSDYHTVKMILKQIAALPPLAADSGEWWALNACSDSVVKHETRIAMHCLLPNHYTATSESAKSMKQTLRALLKAMLPAQPDAASIYRILSERADRPLRLSDMVNTLNELEQMREIVEQDGGDKSHSAEAVLLALLDDNLEVEVDCGKVVSADQMRGVIERYGARVRGCRRCNNWFTVDEGNERYGWYDKCPPCSKHWFPGIFTGGTDYSSSEERLTIGIDKWTSSTIDLAPKVALAEETTLTHARLMMAGQSEETPKERTAELELCPSAADCKTMCGELQRSGERPFPITPHSGKFDDCHLYSFFRMAEGADDEARELIAQQWITSINDNVRREKEEAERREQAKQVAGVSDRVRKEHGAPAEDKSESTEVSVQAALF